MKFLPQLFLFFITTFLVFPSIGQEKIPKNVQIFDNSENIIESQIAFDHDGPIIIDFWASYCKPCIIKYNTIAPEYEKWKEETNVRIYIVSIDDTERKRLAQKLMDRFEWPFEAYFDPDQSLIEAIDGKGSVPRSFIYDPSGNLILRKSGVKLRPKDGSDFLEAIRELYDGKRSMTEFYADVSEYIETLKSLK